MGDRGWGMGYLGPVPPPSTVVMPDARVSDACCGQMKWTYFPRAISWYSRGEGKGGGRRTCESKPP